MSGTVAANHTTLNFCHHTSQLYIIRTTLYEPHYSPGALMPSRRRTSRATTARRPPVPAETTPRPTEVRKRRSGRSEWCCIYKYPSSPTTFSLAVTAVNEIQELSCRADNGSFMLSFRENVTLPIDWNATLPEFKHRLEQLFT